MKKLLKTALATSLLLSVSTPALASSAEPIVQKNLEVVQAKKESKELKLNHRSAVKNGLKIGFFKPEGNTDKEALEFYQTSIEAIMEIEGLGESNENDVYFPTVAEEPSYYNGTVLRTSTNSFFVNVYGTIKDSLYTSLDALITSVGYKYADSNKKAAALVFLAEMGASTISATPDPEYTRTKLVRFYHSGYRKYVLQEYINVYTDSARTKLKKVELGPVLIEGDGYIRDVKWEY